MKKNVALLGVKVLFTGMFLFFTIMTLWLAEGVISQGRYREIPVIIIPLAASVIMGLLAYSLISFRVIIDDNGIATKEGRLRTNQLLFTQMESYSVKGDLITVKSKGGLQPLSFGRDISPEAVDWVYKNLPEVGETQEGAQYDEELGSTKTERWQKTFGFIKLEIGGIIVAVAIGAWAVFSRHPYLLCCTVSLVFPLIVLLVYRYYRGKIKFIAIRGSGYRSIYLSIIIPIGCLFIPTIFDYNDLALRSLLPVIITVAILFVALCLLAQRGGDTRNENKVSGYPIMLLAGIMYGFCVAAIYNGYGITSSNEYHTKVLGKHISSSRSNTDYYLHVQPWGLSKAEQDEHVGKTLYTQTAVGDSINIHLYTGRLGATWHRYKY